MLSAPLDRKIKGRGQSPVSAQAPERVNVAEAAPVRQKTAAPYTRLPGPAPRQHFVICRFQETLTIQQAAASCPVSHPAEPVRPGRPTSHLLPAISRTCVLSYARLIGEGQGAEADKELTSSEY